MERLGLKEDIIEKVKQDPILFGKIASILKISPFSLPRLLKINDPKLTQADVLITIKETLSIKKDGELLTEIPLAQVA